MADGRFAPSPTGDLHLGNLRTALLAWLSARHAGSALRMRMEDLDAASVRPGVAERQLHDLSSLGLDWDGGVLWQSSRRAAHDEVIAELEAAGLTYPCYCTRREILDAAAAPHGDGPEGAYPGTCRELSAAARAERERDGRRPAIRLRADGVHISFVDLVAGEQARVVDDVVVRRNDGTPAYNLAVVVDDAAQGIGEVVRGDDLLSSTPRQIHLAHLLDLPVPRYAHVPLVLGPDGRRLAKRDGPVTLAERLERGETIPGVLGRLAASVGLWPIGDSLAPDDLPGVAVDFEITALPRDPWVLDPQRESGSDTGEMSGPNEIGAPGLRAPGPHSRPDT